MTGMHLTHELESLRKTVEEFAHDVVAPKIGDFYERNEFPYDIVRQMGEMGLFGLPFPEEHGGMGGDYFALCLVLEELARVDSSVAITLEAGVSLGAMPIHRFGTAEQKAEWLPKLCSGEVLGAFGLTEPGGGSDAGATLTTARARRRRVGDQRHQGVHHQLRHRHHRAGHGHRGDRGSATTAARRSPSIIVPCGHAGLHGVARSTPRSAGTPRTPASCRSTTAGCRRRTCSASAGGATRSSCRILDEGRIAIAALAVGLAQGCVDESVKYAQGARTRSASRSATNQAIQFKIADMEMRAHTARLAYYDAAARMLRGEPFKRQAAIAKLYSSEIAVTNAREATQIHGGYGFMNEFPVARMWRDSKILEIGEGTSEVQRMLIARDLGL